MKKSILLTIAAVVTASWATQVIAQESVLFFDVRDNSTSTDFGGGTPQVISQGKRPWLSGDSDPLLDPLLTGAINAGKEGSGQILRLSPTGVNALWQNNNAYNGGLNNEAWPNYDRDNLLSTGDAYLYLKMNANVDAPAGVNDCYSSLGFSLDGSQLLAGTRNPISSVSFQLLNSGVAGVASGSPWNNKLDGTVSGSAPPVVTGVKAARVPVNTGPVYQASLGMVPGATYRIGKMRVTAGVRNCTITLNNNSHVKKSTFLYKMRNNNILTTRVFQSGGNATPAEVVAYGYTTSAAGGETANATGSVENATSTASDLVVQIRLKGDANGDGSVDGNDTPVYLPLAPGTPSPNVLQTYLFDFNHDRKIDGNDTPGFLQALTFNGATCP